MSRAFLNWEPPEHKKRGVKYIAWLHDGKQKIYKPVNSVPLPVEFSAELIPNINKNLDALVADALSYSWRKRNWAKATPEMIAMWKDVTTVMAGDVVSFINAYGGFEQWKVTAAKAFRNWSDPNLPCAWIRFTLDHTDPLAPFTIKLGFCMTAQAKRVKIHKTSYEVENVKMLEEEDRYNRRTSPFAMSLPLGGMVKVVMDGAAKDSTALTLTHTGNGNIPRYWDIVCTIVDLLTGDHYKYFNKAIETCKGQFAEMALKSLTELLTINQKEISYNGDQMSLGQQLNIRFLDIPDTFEENPEDQICEDEEDSDDE